MSTIKDLIRAALDAGKTVRQLEKDSGGRVRYQTFQELSNVAPKNFPKDTDKTITGMAIALGVSETTVVLAYAKGLGIPVDTGSPFALRIPPGVDRLDPTVQETFLSLLRAVIRHPVAGAAEPSASSEASEDEEASDSSESVLGDRLIEGGLPGTPTVVPKERRVKRSK